MSPSLKPIKLWGRGGPNPPKVHMLLEELGLGYEIVPIDFQDVKKPEYTAINPNGRLPSIQDPNTDLTLWESGAIMEYLVERYDTAHRLSFAPGTPESYLAKQWLFFQMTGQGPYYGQVVWFKKYHAEQLLSAIERYVKEINRVSGVLEGHLAKQKKQHGGDGPWFVGGKMSYVDLAFTPWQHIVALVTEKEEYNVDDYPHVKEWLSRMTARESVKTALKL